MRRATLIAIVVAVVLVLSAIGGVAWATGTRNGECCGDDAQEQCCEQAPEIVDVPDCCAG